MGAKTRSDLVQRGIVQVRQEVRGGELQGGKQGQKVETVNLACNSN